MKTTPHVIRAIEDATPTWLTARLRDSVALPHGKVIRIEVHDNPAFNSIACHLEPVYDQDAPTNAPHRLFLKLKSDHDGQREVGLYRAMMAVDGTAPPHDHSALVDTPQSVRDLVIRCHAAEYDQATGASHLLLDDVGDTHAPAVTRSQVIGLKGVPAQSAIEGIIDALARWHGHWWEHERLGREVWTVRSGSFENDAAFEKSMVGKAREWMGFKSQVGDKIPADDLTLLQHAHDRLPRIWSEHLRQRFADLKTVTLIHGDGYVNQFMCPRSDLRAGHPNAPTFIADLDSVSTNVGADDLVFLMATFWTPEQRAQGGFETGLINRYLKGLADAGVQDFSRDDLLDDYRAMLAWRIFHPVWDQQNGTSEAYWQPKLRCLVGAYRDHGVAEWLDGLSD